MDRRAFLTASARIAALAAMAPLAACVPAGQVRFQKDPFSLGVASGDPTADGVVLWTRLAPEPLGGGGVPSSPVSVEWLVASDEAMRQVVRTGATTALPELAHSVHVEVAGLDPDRMYWYRFRAGGAESPIGRTRTAPSGRSGPVRFAVGSCQNYAHGFFTAHANIAREDLNAVLFLGDYIYEGNATGAIVREYAKRGWSFTLADYRDRHAQYRSDKDLQSAHAAFPWIVTWDDHEVENNYAGGIDVEDQRNRFAVAQRTAAYQAYYEHMPIRTPRPQGPSLKLYRSISYGDLASIFVVDTRQHRSPEVALCRESEVTSTGYCPASIDPRRSMLGVDQRRWLVEGLQGSRGSWNVVAQSVRFAQHDSGNDRGGRFDGVDNWMGYVADRQILLDQFARTKNPVVLSGDSHVNFIYDLKADFFDPSSRTVATELLGTSISSEGDPVQPATAYDNSPRNPHLRFFDNHRGYLRLTLEAARLVADFRVVATVRSPTSPVSTLATFAVEDGRPGAKRA